MLKERGILAKALVHNLKRTRGKQNISPMLADNSRRATEKNIKRWPSINDKPVSILTEGDETCTVALDCIHTCVL